MEQLLPPVAIDWSCLVYRASKKEREKKRDFIKNTLKTNNMGAVMPYHAYALPTASDRLLQGRYFRDTHRHHSRWETNRGWFSHRSPRPAKWTARRWTLSIGQSDRQKYDESSVQRPKFQFMQHNSMNWIQTTVTRIKSEAKNLVADKLSVNSRTLFLTRTQDAVSAGQFPPVSAVR